LVQSAAVLPWHRKGIGKVDVCFSVSGNPKIPTCGNRIFPTLLNEEERK